MHPGHQLRQIGKRGLLALLVLAAQGCSAAFWQGFSEGLASQQNRSRGYAPGTASARAEDRLCVKYQITYGWSKGYHVEADVMSGSELNHVTSTLSYNAFATYVAVFWGQGQVSLLELDHYYGTIAIGGQLATDQRGRRWRVADTDICY